MKNIAKYTAYILLTLYIAWFTLSFIEINSKNIAPNPVYNQYNMFIVLENLKR